MSCEIVPSHFAMSAWSLLSIYKLSKFETYNFSKRLMYPKIQYFAKWRQCAHAHRE